MPQLDPLSPTYRALWSGSNDSCRSVTRSIWIPSFETDSKPSGDGHVALNESILLFNVSFLSTSIIEISVHFWFFFLLLNVWTKIKNKTKHFHLLHLVLFTIETKKYACVCLFVTWFQCVYRFKRLFLSCFVTNSFDKASILLAHGHSEVYIYRCCNAFVFLLRSSENEEKNENIFRCWRKKCHKFCVDFLIKILKISPIGTVSFSPAM